MKHLRKLLLALIVIVVLSAVGCGNGNDFVTRTPDDNKKNEDNKPTNAGNTPTGTDNKPTDTPSPTGTDNKPTNTPSPTGTGNNENDGYSLEYELQYYWWEDAEGRHEAYPTAENDSWPAMPWVYVYVEHTKSGTDWCTVDLCFISDGAENYVKSALERVNRTYDQGELMTYEMEGGGFGSGGISENGPYTINGCGTEILTVKSEYEYGNHTTYVFKLVLDSRNYSN